MSGPKSTTETKLSPDRYWLWERLRRRVLACLLYRCGLKHDRSLNTSCQARIYEQGVRTKNVLWVCLFFSVGWTCSSPPPYLNQVLYNHTRRKKNVLLSIFFHTCSIHPSSLLLSPLLHPRPPPSTPVSYCLPAVLPTINLSANELGLSLPSSAATFFMFRFFFLFFVRLSTDPLTGM